MANGQLVAEICYSDGRGRVADGSDVDGYEGLGEEELGDNALG